MSENISEGLYSSEAEEALLGSLLIDGKSLKNVTLSPGDFFEETHAEIYKAMCALYERGEGVDEVTVAHELGGGDIIACLPRLVNKVPVSTHFGYYAKIVQDCAQRRAIVAFGANTAKLASEKTEPSEILAQCAKQLHGLQLEAKGVELLTPVDLSEIANEHFMKLNEHRLGLNTGLNFEFYPGEYIMLAARPAMGKTTLALQIATYIASEKPVLFASLEMGLLGLIDKFVAAEAEINIGTLRAGQYINSTFAEIMQSIENMAKLKLYFYRGKAQTSELRRACEMMKATYGLELLVIDYLQLFRDMPTASETERVTYISREINSIAKDLDIPVLCLSQLSRMPEGRTDKRPQLSDLRSSGALEQDADVVLFLFRKNYYDPDNTDSETELIISKQRLGNAVGRKIKLDFNPIIGKYKGKTEYKEML